MLIIYFTNGNIVKNDKENLKKLKEVYDDINLLFYNNRDLVISNMDKPNINDYNAKVEEENLRLKTIQQNIDNFNKLKTNKYLRDDSD